MGIFPGGFCVRPCAAAQEDKPCGDGDGICIGLPSSSGAKTFVCFPACGTGVNCRRDYQCSLEAKVQTADGFGVCVPRCEFFSQCATGFTCDRSVGLCIRGGVTAEPAQVERQDLGSVTVGSSNAQNVSVTVPSGAVSFSFIGTSQDTQAYVNPVKVTAPNGQVVFDARDPLKSDLKTVAYLPGLYALQFPNAPRLNLIPGQYEILLAANPITTVKVDALIKRQNGVAQGASLPLVFLFTRQRYVNAQTAPSDARFREALSVFTEIYLAAGIQIGPVSYVDLQGADAEALAVPDDEQLNELFAKANDSESTGLHFLMVDHFNFTGGGTVLGVSGGIPGPPAHPGLAKRGVAVALAYPQLGGVKLGGTMAHEAGHYLGLYHTGERDGLSFDPLIDTPECNLTADLDGDRIVSNAECQGRGNDNLMFWTQGEVPRVKVSNDQRFVLLRNPSVQ